MIKKFCSRLLFVTVMIAFANSGYSQNPCVCDQICGKWMSEEKNLEIQVYRDKDDFKAKIIWFDDSDDKTRPMETRTDTDNPDVSLRDRKVLGMSVLEKLSYVPQTQTWENGVIYDAKHGRKWESAAYIDNQGKLRVKGYWHYKWIGKTLTFKRV